MKPGKANLILPLKCQGQSYVIISTFLCKKLQTFHEILCSRNFHVWSCYKIGQGHQLNDLVSTAVPDATCTCKVSWPLVNWFWRRIFIDFYHIWAWWPLVVAILVMWPGQFKHIFVSEGHIWNMVTIGLLAFDEMFEFVKIMVVPGSKVKQWPWPFLPQIFIYLLRQLCLPFLCQNLQNFPWNPIY